MMLVLGVTSAWADTVYTLTPASGSNNSYTGNCDVTIDGITWNITGNSQMQPWRLGGKSITKVNRPIYSKTAISETVTSVTVTNGSASSITVNSFKLDVYSTAALCSAGGTGDVSSVTGTFAANGTTTFNCPSGHDWTGRFYRFTYNLSVSGSSNKFVEFTKAVFEGGGTPPATKSLDHIAVTGTPETLWTADDFTHNGMTVTAYYDDNTNADVTSGATFTPCDMTTAGNKTVQVSYTEGDVTKNSSYNVTVNTIKNDVDHPYTVAQAKALIDAGDGLKETVFVAGKVCQVDSYNGTYHSITYWISADGTTDNKFEVYSGLNDENESAFTSKDDIEVGADVIVKGVIKKYSSTYEFDMNNRLVSYIVTPKYTVTYAAGGADGTVPASVTDYENTVIQLAQPTNLSKTYYTFAGWNDGASTYQAGANYTITANVTMTAQWTENQKYAITVSNDDSQGTVVTIDEAHAGETVEIDIEAEDGYEISAITVTGQSGNVQVSPAVTPSTTEYTFTMPAEPVTVAFTWVASKVYYTVELLQSTGGTISADKTVDIEANEIVTLSATPAEHYTFKEWEVLDGSANEVTVNNNQFTMPASNVTVSASFQEDDKYMVLYYAGGASGDTPEDVEVYDGTTIQLPGQGSLTKTGFSFAGWNDGNQTYQAGAEYTVTDDVEFTAQWAELSQVTVTVMAQGSQLAIVNVYPGDNLLTALAGVSAPASTKDGFSFAGWAQAQDTDAPNIADANTTVNTNMTVWAVYGKTVAGSESWDKVTDASDLAVDDVVVVIAASGYDYALSTNQASSNRTATGVTKSNNQLVNLSNDVQQLTLAAGSSSGQFAFGTGSGYLYASSSSSNQLKTQDNINANASWSISISDGVASIVAQGTNSRNVMRFNPNNGSPIFACYASATQQPLALYKKNATQGSTTYDFEIAQPKYAVTISATQNGTVTADKASVEAGETVTLTVAPATHYSLGTLTVRGDVSGSAVTVNDNQFTMPAEAVTVSATFVEDAKYLVKYNVRGNETSETVYDGENLVSVPNVQDISNDWKFLGWTETEISLTETAPALFNTSEAITAAHTLYAVYMKGSGAQPVTATLYNSEITSNLTGTYGDFSITDSYGTWSGNACCQGNVSKDGMYFLQLRNSDPVSYLKLPEFEGDITSVVLGQVCNTSKAKFTGEIYFRTEANNSAVAVATATSETALDNVTLTIPAGYKTGYIMVSDACRIFDVTVNVAGGKNYYALDEEVTEVEITIGTATRGTYASEYALDFSGVEGLTAYVCTGTDEENDKPNNLVMQKVLRIEAGNGLYVAGEPKTYTVPVYTGDDFDEIDGYNCLIGNISGGNLEINNNDVSSVTKYILQNGTKGLKFYKVRSNSSEGQKYNTVANHRAYLELPTPSAGAKEWLDIDIEGDATAIADVNGNANVNVNGMFDLSGRKVNAQAKGIIIVNGKKVLVK